MVAEAKDQSQEACQEDRRNGYYAPKVRKPYTITKQREKWTEEEHLKFVEALKLYGRAWRQIEEHVGSKTAIQIRSHAQKFFAKVSRDSSTDVEGSSSPVPIPPPRPKKKPLHPYPRKTVDPAASPTSVSSAIASDEMHESRLSPASDALSANLFTKNDHGASSSKEEEHGFWLSMKISAKKSTTKFELFPQETESTSDSPYNISAPYPSIKLFGKTVVVRDSSESSSLGCVVNEKSESNSSQVVFALPWYTWYPYPHAQVVKDEEGSNTWNLGKESSRGFVPYKRCLAASARDGKSLQGRRARVCS